MVAPWTRVSCGRTTRTRWLAKTATSRIDIAITWVVISASMVHCAMSDNMVCRTAPVAMSNASRSSPSAKWCETTKTGTTATASTQPSNTPFESAWVIRRSSSRGPGGEPVQRVMITEERSSPLSQHLVSRSSLRCQGCNRQTERSGSSMHVGHQVLTAADVHGRRRCVRHRSSHIPILG